jgi:hypothetical protein
VNFSCQISDYQFSDWNVVFFWDVDSCSQVDMALDGLAASIFKA